MKFLIHFNFENKNIKNQIFNIKLKSYKNKNKTIKNHI